MEQADNKPVDRVAIEELDKWIPRLERVKEKPYFYLRLMEFYKELRKALPTKENETRSRGDRYFFYKKIEGLPKEGKNRVEQSGLTKLINEVLEDEGINARAKKAGNLLKKDLEDLGLKRKFPDLLITKNGDEKGIIIEIKTSFDVDKYGSALLEAMLTKRPDDAFFIVSWWDKCSYWNKKYDPDKDPEKDRQMHRDYRNKIVPELQEKLFADKQKFVKGYFAFSPAYNDPKNLTLEEPNKFLKEICNFFSKEKN